MCVTPAMASVLGDTSVSAEAGGLPGPEHRVPRVSDSLAAWRGGDAGPEPGPLLGFLSPASCRSSPTASKAAQLCAHTLVTEGSHFYYRTDLKYIISRTFLYTAFQAEDINIYSSTIPGNGPCSLCDHNIKKNKMSATKSTGPIYLTLPYPRLPCYPLQCSYQLYPALDYPVLQSHLFANMSDKDPFLTGFILVLNVVSFNL